MTHPAAGAPHPRPPDAEPDALTAGLTPEQARRGPPRPRAAADRRRARHRQDPHAHPPRRPPAGHRPRARRGEILAVTFSVRAAGELRLRLADLLGEQTARGVTAATFHSVCARLLREHAGAVRAHRRLHDLRPGRPAARDRVRCSPTTGAAAIQQALAALRAAVGGRARDRDRAGQEPAARPPTRYERASRAPRRRRWSPPCGGRVDARARALQRVRRSTTCSSSRCGCCASTRTGSRTCARRWRWLVVDEMQDTNEAQAALRAPARRRRTAT